MWKKLLFIFGALSILFLLGWVTVILAEGFIEFCGDILPTLWKGFLEGIRQLGEAWRGHKSS